MNPLTELIWEEIRHKRSMFNIRLVWTGIILDFKHARIFQAGSYLDTAKQLCQSVNTDDIQQAIDELIQQGLIKESRIIDGTQMYTRKRVEYQSICE